MGRLTRFFRRLPPTTARGSFYPLPKVLEEYSPYVYQVQCRRDPTYNWSTHSSSSSYSRAYRLMDSAVRDEPQKYWRLVRVPLHPETRVSQKGIP